MRHAGSISAVAGLVVLVGSIALTALSDMRPSERSALRSLRVGALPIDSVGADELADGDLGDVSVSGGVVSIDNDVVDAANMGVISQSDTNDNTVATAYAPDFIGQILIGNTGGTNAIWIAYGLTTNDWKAAVSP